MFYSHKGFRGSASPPGAILPIWLLIQGAGLSFRESPGDRGLVVAERAETSLVPASSRGRLLGRLQKTAVQNQLRGPFLPTFQVVQPIAPALCPLGTFQQASPPVCSRTSVVSLYRRSSQIVC